MSDTYVRFRNDVLAGGTDNPEGSDDTAGGPRAIIALVVIVGLLVLLGVKSRWGLIFVLGMLVSIFLHELGHFVTARRSGMKATQFFLFMGPKLWSFRRGETEYGLRTYPVGAFVRIIGMNNLDEVDPVDEPRAYRNQSYPKRMLVICAGSIMHMIIAITLMFGVYAVNGRIADTGTVQVGSLGVDGPAAKAGVQPNDLVVSLDGVRPASPEQFVSMIHAHAPGDTVQLAVHRATAPLTFAVVLGTNPNEGSSKGTAYLGVGADNERAWTQGSIVQAVPNSLHDLGSTAWQSFAGIGKVLNPVNIYDHLVGTNNDPSTRPSTVVGIGRASDSIGKQTGIGGILITLALINVFVGLLNLFPLLPFDGGHAAIATYERLRSRRGKPAYHADVTKMIPVAMATIMLLSFVFIAAFYLDIAKPL